jgi:UDPglucose 6-dehydrogenase
MSRITVVGAGYVGLVTAAGLAHLGHPVAVLETDRHRLTRLREGHLPIHEPGLPDIVSEAVSAGRLEFGDNYAAVVPSSDFVFVAVNTPPRADGSADTSYVLAAARSVLEFARPGLIIVTKSTVPVGTGDEIERLVDASGTDHVHVASNPEFLREGSAVEDFLRPDRVVVGADSPEIGRRVASLYDGCNAPVVLTTRRSAELAKYAANAALATRISFMNEMATICEATGADVAEVARIVGSDSRIGPKFLQAGLGWGGSCFPKDLSALAATAHGLDRSTPILSAVMAVNARQRAHAVELLLAASSDAVHPSVAVLGLTFKPDTDDLRGSPALDVIARLLAEGVTVKAHDPMAMAHASLLLPSVHYAASAYEAAAGTDALLLATEWPEYLRLDWLRIRHAMRGAFVLDGRNVLPGGILADLGFDYRSFGRPAPLPPRVPASAHWAPPDVRDRRVASYEGHDARRAADPVS